MKKPIRNLLLVSIFLFILSLGSCTIGVEYDRRNNLYPENEKLAYDLGITVYGKRWERIGDTLFLLGSIMSITDFFYLVSAEKRC